MLAVYSRIDPWLTTVHTLSAITSGCSDRPHLAQTRPSDRRAPFCAATKFQTDTNGGATITVVERLNQLTAVIDWRDATAGCYAGQTWRAGVARKSGRCALSGAVIHKGDAVYRPRTPKLFRANAGSMILACELEGARICDEA